MNSPERPFNRFQRHNLAELYQEIAKDKVWRTSFLYVPIAVKAGLKFHQMTQKKPCPIPDEQLLIGHLRTNGQARVYARVYFRRDRLNLVDVHLHNDTVIELHRVQEEKESELLRGVQYVEPFDRLAKPGSRSWRSSLRFLVLFYFLENQALDRLAFTLEGREALRRACANIADGPIHRQEKPVRSRHMVTRAQHALRSTSKITNTQTPVSTQRSEEGEKTSTLERAPLPSAAPVKVPENDSTRAVSIMVQRHDSVAARLPQDAVASHQEPEPKPESPILAGNSKRKRSESDVVMKEEEPELVLSRFKRLVRDRVENLEREQTEVQNTLKAQTVALTGSQNQVSSLEKTLLAAKKELEAVKVARAVTETRLEEMRSEVAKNKTFEKDFEVFRA